MTLTFDEYTMGRFFVAEITENTYSENDILEKTNDKILMFNGCKKMLFIDHIDTLFLNKILNKKDEIGESGLSNAIECRKIINNYKFENKI